ncbi:MAG: hypothetical protein HC820_03450 [Hydrococcus sp. RM1_1_31]|nr:hypothetical protein [Hydrococcus sp. RM1_1_31]
MLGFGLFLLLASPAIILTLSAFGREAVDKNLWYLVSQVRFPHHLFPFTWNKIEYAKYGAILVLLLALLYQNRDKFKQLFKLCAVWALISFLWLLYAFVAAYVTKSPSMLVMHPGRSITLWYGIAAIALVTLCATKIETTRGMTQKAFWVAILSREFFTLASHYRPVYFSSSTDCLGIKTRLVLSSCQRKFKSPCFTVNSVGFLGRNNGFTRTMGPRSKFCFSPYVSSAKQYRRSC